MKLARSVMTLSLVFIDWGGGGDWARSARLGDNAQTRGAQLSRWLSSHDLT